MRRSECGYNVYLLDENGNEVEDGQKGEVCFENPYVRGYINLPEQTAEVFKDGIYHTGDIARKDSEGRIVICGRLNDMVKINGNRVEPGEIEGVAKKVLGIDWAAARIFDDYQDDYVAPRDEVETALCDAFAKVFEMKKIGIKDDFYQLGGDSLGSMDVISEAGLPGLTATDIFRGHTPEKIAVLYKEHVVEGEAPDEIN